jgi:purine-binding chemotaxis protein CheW
VVKKVLRNSKLPHSASSLLAVKCKVGRLQMPGLLQEQKEGVMSKEDKPTTTVAPREVQLVLFMMSGSEFGVEIQQVREINRVGEITKVPKAPEFLEGVMNLRGRIVPVVDLKKRFKLPSVKETSQSRIIITEVGDQFIGLWVDKVTEVLKIAPSAVAPPPEMILTIAGEYLSGLVEVKDRLVILLNLPRILRLDEIKALADAEMAASEEKRSAD